MAKQRDTEREREREREREKKKKRVKSDLSINRSEFNLADAIYCYAVGDVKASLCKRVSFSQYNAA